VKLGCYKYRILKRGRGRELDSGVNRGILASRKPGERILLMLYCSILFKFVHLCSAIISNYKLKYTLEYYLVTPLSIVLLLLLLDTFTRSKCDLRLHGWCDAD